MTPPLASHDLSDHPARWASLAVLGFGGMGSAIVRGAIAAGAIEAATTLVIEPDDARRVEAETLGCRVATDLRAASDAERLLLAVKPQTFAAIAPQLAARRESCLVLSIMAGLSLARLGAGIGERHRFLRAMPNTPARLGKGVTALAPGQRCSSEDLAFAERLFSSVGRITRVDESLFDAVTAVSGSGPAYVLLLAEAWEAAAMELGLAPEVARTLVRTTIEGAAAMLCEPGADPGVLRAAVTSRGGTTEAAISVFERHELRRTVREALQAAVRRGAELGS